MILNISMYHGEDQAYPKAWIYFAHNQKSNNMNLKHTFKVLENDLPDIPEPSQ